MTGKNSNKENPVNPSEGFAHGVAPGVKWAVVIMGIMLIIGMVVVFSTIIYRTVKLSSGKNISKVTKVDPYPDINLSLKSDAVVKSVSLDGNRVALQIDEGHKITILVLDVKKGQVISKVTLDKAE